MTEGVDRGPILYFGYILHITDVRAYHEVVERRNIGSNHASCTRTLEAKYGNSQP